MRPMNAQSAPSGEPATPWRLLVALLAVLFLAHPYFYAPPARPGAAVGGELVGEGRALALAHPQLRSLSQGEGGFGELVRGDWWGGLRPDEVLYRPLSSATLGLAATVAGKPYSVEAPQGRGLPHKLFSLALHAICALLVVELAWRLFQRAPHAIAAGLLFATLPVHAGTVVDVGGIAMQLGTALGLAAWCAWLRVGAGQALAAPLAAVLAFLASLAHELAFALPVLFLLVDAGRAGSGGIGAGLAFAAKRLPAHGLLLVALGASALVRVAMVGALFPARDLGEPVLNPLLEAGGLERLMGGLALAAAGLPVMLGLNPLASRPFGFSADYSAAQIELSGAFAFGNLIGLAALLLAVGVALIGWNRCRTRAALLLALVGSLVLMSTAFVPMGTAFDERRLFLPSALLCLLIAPFLGRFGKGGLAVALGLAVANGVWLRAESAQRATERGLWERASALTATQSARAKLEVGGSLMGDVLHAMAAARFEEAVRRAPEWPMAYARLAAARLAGFDPGGAAQAYLMAVETHLDRVGWNWTPRELERTTPPSSLLHPLTRLRVEDPGGEADLHLDWLDTLVARGYRSPHVELYRAQTLINLGRVEEAEAAFARSLEIHPLVENVRSYSRFLMEFGRAEEADQLLQRHVADLGAGPAARAELELYRADANLALDPRATLEAAQRVLADADQLSPEQRFRARLLSAQARLDLPAEDSIEQARRVAQSVDDLGRGLAEWQRGDEQVYVAAHTLGLLLFEQGRFTEARRTAEELLRLREGPSQRAMLGAIHYYEGRYEEARRQLELASPGLRRGGEAANPNLYLMTRLLELESLGLTDSPQAQEHRERIVSEIEQGSPLDRLAFALHLAHTGSASRGLDIARQLAEAGQSEAAELLAALERNAEIETIGALGALPVMLLEEQAALRLFLRSPKRALDSARAALENTPEGEDRARRLGLRARAEVRLGLSEEALVTLDEALSQPELSERRRSDLETYRAELRALLGRD